MKTRYTRVSLMPRGLTMFEFNQVVYQNILSIDSLKIERKHVTCIVGQSGGGKTTFLRLLAKLISPTSGDILYDGKSLETLDSLTYRQSVVMMSQKPPLFEGTIRDNFVRTLSFHQKPVWEDQLLNVLTIVQLDKPLETPVSTLSGGEAQRVALARVLLLDPDVILLDEPSSALDEATEAQLIETVVEYVKEGQKTLIMVTHSKAMARRHGDRIVTIHQGHVKEG